MKLISTKKVDKKQLEINIPLVLLNVSQIKKEEELIIFEYDLTADCDKFPLGVISALFTVEPLYDDIDVCCAVEPIHTDTPHDCEYLDFGFIEFAVELNSIEKKQILSHILNKM